MRNISVSAVVVFCTPFVMRPGKPIVKRMFCCSRKLFFLFLVDPKTHRPRAKLANLLKRKPSRVQGQLVYRDFRDHVNLGWSLLLFVEVIPQHSCNDDSSKHSNANINEDQR
jgi:hypothetical protein